MGAHVNYAWTPHEHSLEKCEVREASPLAFLILASGS
jgi:hypothetical protein